MHFSILVLLASAVSGMSLNPRQSLPHCAVTCITNAVLSSGCPLSNQTCLCKSSVFVSTAAACIQSACSPADQNTAVQGAEALCKSVGVTVDASLYTSSGSATETSDASTSTAFASDSTSDAATDGASTFSLSLMPPSSPNTRPERIPFVLTGDILIAVTHYDEIPFVFGNPANLTDIYEVSLGTDPAVLAVSKSIMGAWISFARHLNPNHVLSDLPYWPSYAESASNMVFDANGSFVEPDDYRKDGIAFINARPEEFLP
ncbi:hypothetical protein BDZ89DRAFT_1066782 [Hymenopellis radicata]|nr:hypothetical protein BDZ89DRAFT_1066782 [Hymenopellis radicata]